MQTGIALLTWALARIFTASRTIDSLAASLSRWRQWRCKQKGQSLRAAKPSSRFRSRVKDLEQTNFANSTGTFLAEFQEAQCFFVVAIQAVVLYANYKPANFTNAENVQDLFTNYNIARRLYSMQVWPIILTQISLRRVRLDSIYTLVLSSLALVLAAITRTSDTHPLNRDWDEMFKDHNSLPACGHHTSLRTYCKLEHKDETGLTKWPTHIDPMVASAMSAILAVLWWEKLWPLFRTKYLDQHNWLDRPQRKRLFARTSRKISKTTPAFLFGFEALLIYFITQGLVDMPIRVSLWNGKNVEWNTGQAIAMLVWAPVLAKYLYLIRCRLATPFKKRDYLRTQWTNSCTSHSWRRGGFSGENFASIRYPQEENNASSNSRIYREPSISNVGGFGQRQWFRTR